MATIRARPSKGGTRYTAVIRLFRGGKLYHRETRTFSRRTLAADWARRREVELEHPGALLRAQQGATGLGKLIQWYIEEFEQVTKWQRTKGQHLRLLMRQDIAQADALSLTGPALVDHVRQRRAGGTGPATAANDLIWIGVVLRAARSVRGLAVSPSVVDEAREACRALRLIGRGGRRDRRPTDDELRRLREHFASRPRSSIPMTDILDFAIASCRREAEICRLEWADNDAAERTGLVRDAKHPREKIGNHLRFKYTPEGWAIVKRQPKLNARIFPYDPQTVGAAFTRACSLLGIEDLRFHDLRHHAISMLFERGYQIHEVAMFSLHSSWNDLKRYANLRPGSVRELPASQSGRPSRKP